jgi:predicted phosphoribosyltransferase
MPYRCFENREHGARELSKLLAAYKGRRPLVLAIPRGALPIGRLVADELGGDLDVVLVHKLGAPMEPELAIGAVDESGHVWTNPETRGIASDAYVKQEVARQVALLARKRARITPIRSPIRRNGRVVIVVDDGVATGSSMMAALLAVRAQGPSELVAAAPTMSTHAHHRLTTVADEVVAPVVDEHFLAVGDYYRDFRQVDDDEVVTLLRMAAGTAGRAPCNDDGPLRRDHR